MSRLLLTAAVLAVLVYAMVLGVRWLTPRIEQDIADRVTTGLAEQGLLWADVTVKGREVTLSGEAPSGESREKAVTAASKVFGVAKVNNELFVAGEASATVAGIAPRKAKSGYTLTITKDGDKLVLDGEVSSDADKAILERLAATHYGEGNVDSENLKVAEGAPAGWRSAAGTVLYNIFNMEQAQVTLSDTEVMVSGTVIDKQYSEQMEEAVKSTLPAAYKAAFAVEVVTPTVKVAAIEPAAGDSDATCETLDEVKKERLYFEFDKAEITEAHKETIGRVTDKMAGCTDKKMVVAGFTDITGSKLYNKWLSQQRADATVREMMREGVDKARLRAQGYGEQHPAASNGTREGRVQNRRVEFFPGADLPYKVMAAGKKALKKASKIAKPWWASQRAADATVEETPASAGDLPAAPVVQSPTTTDGVTSKNGAWLGEGN